MKKLIFIIIVLMLSSCTTHSHLARARAKCRAFNEQPRFVKNSYGYKHTFSVTQLYRK